MAWRITRGTFNGVALDGLTMAAAVAGDRNLGMREMGGEAPHERARDSDRGPARHAAQRDALVQLARELAGGLITDVVRVDIAPVRFATTTTQIEVSAADALTLSVNKEMKHDPSCGAMQWFKPFSPQLTSRQWAPPKLTSFPAPVLAASGAPRTNVRRSGERFRIDR